MAEVLVVGKKISEMELVTGISGDEKIPTGVVGDKAVTTGQLVEYLNDNGRSVWGRIDGDITDQVDLQNQFTQERNDLKSYTQDQVSQQQVALQEHIDVTDEAFKYARDNGSALPYKDGIAYEENAVVVKDGVLQQWKGGVWVKPSHNDLVDRDMAGAHPSAAIFDASGKSQQDINDIALREFNVLHYGADPTGATSSHQAFRDCAAALQAAGGGKVVIPRGNYVVGKQIRHLAGEAGYTWTTPAYEGEDVFFIKDSGTIVVEFQGCSIKFEDGMKYGRWNAATEQPILDGTMPFVDHNKKAIVGRMFGFQNNTSVLITGSADLDGNLTNYNLGGLWGDLGRQCSAYGVWMAGNQSQNISGTIKAHHFGLDGLYVGGSRGDGTSYKEGDDAQNGVVIGFSSLYNGRQGLSHCGGSGMTYISCKFNHTGRGRFFSAPAAGVDVEAESGINRDAVFINCEMMNNVGQAVTDSTGNNERIKFVDCKMVGTTARVGWFMKGEYRNCLIVGAFGVGNDRKSTNEKNHLNKKAEFFDCTFTDDERLSPTGQVKHGVMGEQSETIIYAKFKDCEWHTYHQSYPIGYTSGHPEAVLKIEGGKWVIHEGSTLTGKDLIQFYSSRLEDFEFIDERSESTELDITIAKSYQAPWKNVSFQSATGKLRCSWAGAKINTNKKRYVVNHPSTLTVDSVGSDAQPFWTHRLIKGAGYNTQYYQDNLHITTSKTVVANAHTNLSTNSLFNPFGVSDRVINGIPSDSSWYEAICTTAGYTCPDAWAASTSVALDAYRHANGKVYQALVEGTTGQTSPSHISGSASDGTVTWLYIGERALFRAFGAKGSAVSDKNYTLSETPTVQELATAISAVQSELRALKSSSKAAGYIL